MAKPKKKKRNAKKLVVKKTILNRAKQLTSRIVRSLPGCAKSVGNAVASVGVIVTVLATVAVLVLGAREFFNDPHAHMLAKAFVGGVLAIASGKLVTFAAKYF